MTGRAAKLKRLVSVQRQIERMAETELAEANRERIAVAERIDGLVEALASPAPIHSGFSRLYGVQLGRLKTKDQLLAGRVRLREKRLLSERAKADRLAERAGEADEQERRAQEDDAVYDILDCIDALRLSSLR